MDEPISRVPEFTVCFFTLELVDELDRRETSHAQMMMHDGLYPDGSCQVRLAGPRSADEHDIVSIVDEVATV